MATELTRDMILAEPAGVRMDGWVAERVMGWTYYSSLGGNGFRQWRVTSPPPEENGFSGPVRSYGEYTGNPQDHEWYEYAPIPAYSTDIGAAWEVALWLRERWGQFTLAAGLEWHCMHGIIESRPWGVGDTAMEAICRAALLAVVG
jgi:hypothetical protein